MMNLDGWRVEWDEDGTQRLVRDQIDPDCLVLVESMNRLPGIHTTCSCCGHGKTSFRIWFKAQSLHALRALLYWIDGCHSGAYGWSVIASSDCVMCPTYFAVQASLYNSDTGERREYEELREDARVIAGFLDDWTASRPRWRRWLDRVAWHVPIIAPLTNRPHDDD